MPRKIVEARDLTIPESKAVMEGVNDELGEFQRRTFDYLTKFAKISSDKAREAVKSLTNKFGLSEREAIQLVNCMPSSIEEVRSILAVKGKIILNEELQKILEEIQRFKSR
ncbi:MAG: RNA polymerase Rpb4 family protein [Candidatus Bathyarchaeia archaeon]